MAADKRALRIMSVLHHTPIVDGDVIDRLQPLFEPVLLDQAGSMFDPGAFAKELQARYGWAFSADMAAELCPRFERSGWLEAIVQNGENAAYRVSLDSPLSAAEGAQSEDIEELADEFAKFCRDLSPLLASKITPEVALERLTSWVANLERYDAASLVAEARAVKDPETGQLTYREQNPKSLDQLDADQRYLCARFTQKLDAEKSPLLETLARVAELGFLVDLIEDFQRPTNKPDRTDLIVYLDSRIALSLLGVSGKNAAQSARDLVTSLKKSGLHVRVFQTTVDEMQAALRAVLDRLPIDREGPTHEAILRGETLEAYVNEVSQSTEHFLGEYDVRVDPMTARPTERDLEIFSEEDNSDFYSRVNWNITKELQRQHEADVFTQIMRKRAARKSGEILHARFIFITDNPKFWSLARRYCIENRYINRNEVPPVVSYRHFALSLWLATGFAEINDVPKRQLLAAAEKVLTVRSDIVSDAVRRLGEMSEEMRDQFSALVGSPGSRRVLMDATLNSRKLSSPDELVGVLEDMKTELISKQTEASEKKIQKVKSDSNKRQQQALKEALEAREQAKNAEAVLAAEIMRQRDYHEKQLSSVNRISSWVKWSVVFVVYAVVIFITYLLASNLFSGHTYLIVLIAAIMVMGAITTMGLLGINISLPFLHKGIMLSIARTYLSLRGAQTDYASLHWEDFELKSVLVLHEIENDAIEAEGYDANLV